MVKIAVCIEIKQFASFTAKKYSKKVYNCLLSK